MPQVIYAWNYIQWGGAQTYFLSLIRTVRDRFDVVIVLPEGSNEQLLKFIRDEGVRYEFFSPSYDAKPESGIIDRSLSRYRKMRSEAALLKKLKQFDLSNSIVHIELGPWYSLFALVWLSLRTPVFITMHNALGEANPLRKLIWKLKLRVISRFRNFNVFASNRNSKEYFKGLYSDVLFQRIRVTYTNVDAAEVEEVTSAPPERQEMIRRYELPEDRFLVFCVGQFIDRKGRWDFLEAARRAKESDAGLGFVWIANSAPPAADIERALAYGLGRDFRFITSEQIGGRHIELMKLLSVADAFALPSYVEGLPISLLEAMSLGIPSVSTDVNAIPEALIDRETGILIEPGDPEALAAAILDIKRDESLRKQLGENGSEFVTARFTDRIVGRIALEEYEKALQR